MPVLVICVSLQYATCVRSTSVLDVVVRLTFSLHSVQISCCRWATLRRRSRTRSSTKNTMKSWPHIYYWITGTLRYKVYTLNICRSKVCPTPAMVIFMTIPPLPPQMDECISLSMKPRPGSDLTNSNAQSPSHKVQRSTSSNQKPRRATDAGRKLFGLLRIL